MCTSCSIKLKAMKNSVQAYLLTSVFSCIVCVLINLFTNLLNYL